MAEKSKDGGLFLPPVLQNKYKQQSGSSVFHQMPVTNEMQFVKQVSELQSQVRPRPFIGVSTGPV